MKILLFILKLLLTNAAEIIKPRLTKLISSKRLNLFKILQSKILRLSLVILISLSVGFLIGYHLKSKRQPEINVITEYKTVDRFIEVMPAIPECANFDFDPKIGGMYGNELVAYTAKLYQWGANCSNAISQK